MSFPLCQIFSVALIMKKLYLHSDVAHALVRAVSRLISILGWRRESLDAARTRVFSRACATATGTNSAVAAWVGRLGRLHAWAAPSAAASWAASLHESPCCTRTTRQSPTSASCRRAGCDRSCPCWYGASAYCNPSDPG